MAAIVTEMPLFLQKHDEVGGLFSPRFSMETMLSYTAERVLHHPDTFEGTPQKDPRPWGYPLTPSSSSALSLWLPHCPS